MEGKKAALLITDVQNDFCPGGALPVQEGDRIVPILNRYSALFTERGLPVFACRDYHPPRTTHFKEFGGIWPIHCVQGTRGAEFHPLLQLPPDMILITKGTSSTRDDYSAFDGAAGDGTPFAEMLRRMDVGYLYVGGLTTDYCIKETVLAGLKEGLSMCFLEDAVKGVNLAPDDSRKAVEEMIAAGAGSGTFEEVRSRLFGP